MQLETFFLSFLLSDIVTYYSVTSCFILVVLCIINFIFSLSHYLDCVHRWPQLFFAPNHFPAFLFGTWYLCFGLFPRISIIMCFHFILYPKSVFVSSSSCKPRTLETGNIIQEKDKNNTLPFWTTNVEHEQIAQAAWW